MKNATYRRGAWTITVQGSRSPNLSKNVNHGNNTIIGDVPATLSLAQGRGRFHGSTCGYCAGFPCSKTPRPEQDYCAFTPPRFSSKDRIQ